MREALRDALGGAAPTDLLSRLAGGAAKEARVSASAAAGAARLEVAATDLSPEPIRDQKSAAPVNATAATPLSRSFIQPIASRKSLVMLLAGAAVLVGVAAIVAGLRVNGPSVDSRAHEPAPLRSQRYRRAGDTLPGSSSSSSRRTARRATRPSRSSRALAAGKTPPGRTTGSQTSSCAVCASTSLRQAQRATVADTARSVPKRFSKYLRLPVLLRGSSSTNVVLT